MIAVSVIIPTYGMPDYLEKSIRSVLSQTLSNIELIVVDDNDQNTEARRRTEDLLKQFITDHRVLYLKHSNNMNGAVARNTGIKQAKGKYVSFLDSDDEYLPNRLMECFKIMETTDSQIAGVYTGCEFRRGGKVYHIEKNIKEGNFLLETLACTFMFCTGSNLFIRKAVIDEINGFDEAFLRHQDYEFLVRIFERYSLAAIQDVLVIKNNENINVPNVNKMIDIKKQYIDKYHKQIQDLNTIDRNYVYHSQYLQIAESALRTKQNKLAKQYYSKAAEYGKLKPKEQLRKLVFCVKNVLGSNGDSERKHDL